MQSNRTDFESHVNISGSPSFKQKKACIFCELIEYKKCFCAKTHKIGIKSKVTVKKTNYKDFNTTFTSNQIFHYTRCITPQRVTSWRGAISESLRSGNTASFEMSQRWRAIGNTISDLNGPRFFTRVILCIYSLNFKPSPKTYTKHHKDMLHLRLSLTFSTISSSSFSCCCEISSFC